MDLASILAILHSNDPPSNKESAQIQALIASRRRELDSLDEQISYARDRLAALETQQRHVAIALSTYEISLSAWRRVPPELLVDIFIYCLDASGSSSFPWKRHLPPFSLTLVCSSWRSIVISTPQLWQSLLIACSTPPIRDPKSMLEAWIYRAEPLLIFLTCHATARSHPPMRLNIEPVLDIVDPYAQRLGSIELSLPHNLLISFKFMEHGMLKDLHSLDLFSLDDEDPVGIETLPVFADLPSLRQIRLDPRDDNFKLSNLGVNWSQLTHLFVGWLVEVYDYLPILAQCSNLRECQLDIALLRIGGLLEHPIVTLPKLTELTLSVCDFADSHIEPANHALSHLETPQLTSFSILLDLRGAYLSWPHKTFMDYCERSRFRKQLQRLDIMVDDQLPNSRIRSFAHTFTVLRHLALSGATCLDNETLLLLAAPHILPLLESLELIVVGDSPSASAFKELLVKKSSHQVLKKVMVGHRKPSFRATWLRWVCESWFVQLGITVERRHVLA